MKIFFDPFKSDARFLKTACCISQSVELCLLKTNLINNLINKLISTSQFLNHSNRIARFCKNEFSFSALFCPYLRNGCICFFQKLICTSPHL